MEDLQKKKRITHKLDCVVVEGQSSCLKDCVRDRWLGNSNYSGRVECKVTQFIDSWFVTFL